jgi:hypothetical protein
VLPPGSARPRGLVPDEKQTFGSHGAHGGRRHVRLDGNPVSADERETNRGLEVTVPASPG